MKKSLYFFPIILAAALSGGKLHGQELPSPGIQSSGTLPAAFQNYEIRFSGTSKVLRADRFDNAKALEAMMRQINEHRGELERGEYLIRVASNVAPADGMSLSKARTLARKRASVVKSYLIRKASAREAFFSTSTTTEGKLSQNTLVRIGLVPAEKK